MTQVLLAPPFDLAALPVLSLFLLVLSHVLSLSKGCRREFVEGLSKD
ncbi:MAG TPA: hypothetical protein G4O11_02185 [Anaerolineae bacterium]|nr:hypothetical protein [Anaerolineae bacterium]